MVYGRPAVVGAVGLRLCVRLDELGHADGELVQLSLPQADHREAVSAAALRGYAEAARERWLQYHASPSRELFRRLRGGDPAHLAKVALGEVLLRHPEVESAAWRLEVDSHLPLGSGMGSSAAMAAAIVLAALRLIDRPAPLEIVEQLVQEVERRQHGSPSGVDGAVVLRGGVQWIERENGRLDCRELVPRTELLDKLRVLDTGAPRQATGEVVAQVAELRLRDPQGFAAILERVEESARRLRRGLVQGDALDLATALRSAHRALMALGVVPPAVARTIERIEEEGGAAKISGAGALDGNAAGCLLVYHAEPERLAREAGLDPEQLLSATLGAEGVREEP